MKVGTDVNLLIRRIQFARIVMSTRKLVVIMTRSPHDEQPRGSDVSNDTAVSRHDESRG